MMASLSTTAKVSWSFESTRTVPTVVTGSNSFSWTAKAIVYSLSGERGRVYIIGGRDFRGRNRGVRNRSSAFVDLR
ncbi:hypothetical protein LWI28_006472 [Acer negundo]|uniref:Uncharacterized protein n=1 Tax=Acer negundo TaxID=4023 RepID=A0AAD5NIY1_ACENE|nr:hypothetical protein LWI28_006472 [Acer negundo]